MSAANGAACEPLPQEVRRVLVSVSNEADAVDALAGVGYGEEQAKGYVRRWQAERAAGGVATKPDPEATARLIAQVEQPKSKGLLAQSVSLATLLRDGVPPPSFLDAPTFGDRLFYAEHLFLFAGHKKAGKSWAMALLARDCIVAGRPVVYVDNENGAELFAERLALIGVTWKQAADLHYVPFPDLGRPADLRAEFDAIAQALPGSLVVLDSLRTFMARFGLNPEKNVEVEQMLGPIMASVKGGESGKRITVGIIDHANRNTRETDAYVASGAAAKAQAVDVVYFFDKIEPFNRDQQGVVKIAVKDDRRGLLDFERFYRMGGQGEGQPLFFEPASKTEVGTSGRILLDVRQFIMDATGPLTKTAIRNNVKGDSSAIDRAIDTLVSTPSEPVWSVMQGQRPRFVWDEDRETADALPI